MEKKAIYEMKSLNMKLGDLDKKGKQIICQIVVYAFLLALGIAATIFEIISKNTYLCVMFSGINSCCIFQIVVYFIELEETYKQINAVYKAIDDLISKEIRKAVEKIFEKIFEDITKEEKKEPKKTPAKMKTTTKKTTKKTK